MKTARIACPVHGGGNPNCAVWRDERGRPRAKCWSYNCDPRAILAALGELPDVPLGSNFDAGKSTTVARRLWDTSREIEESPAELYLRSRGLRRPWSASLRHHPNLPHPSGNSAPAMIACVESSDGRFVGVHRTWLTPAGNKANFDPVKAALGPIGGGSVRLTPRIGNELILAEGIETALSVLQALGSVAVWAVLGTSNLVSIELPDCVHEVIIAADADPAGEKAALTAAARLIRDGRKVRVAKPARLNDFNDVLRA